MAKTAVEPRVFGSNEAIIEAHVMGDKNAVFHKGRKAVRDLGKNGGIGHHRITDPRQSGDKLWDGALWIDQALPAVDDLAPLHFDRADLGDAMQRRAASGGFDIHDNINLVRVHDPRDAVDRHIEPGAL